MQTTQLVRGAAEVLTVTTLRVNDCYKRVEETSYSTEPTIQYGVVTDIMDNGNDAAVVAVELQLDPYSARRVQIKTKVITGTSQLAIFPARPDEVASHLDAMLEAAHKQESEAQEALDKAAAQVVQVLRIREAANGLQLTAPEVEEHPPGTDLTPVAPELPTDTF